MLAIAVCAKAFLYKNDTKPTLIYESLDIHRLLLKKNIIGSIMRSIEGFLSKRSDELITSSPAFIDEYFEPISHVSLPTKLIENKVYFPAFCKIEAKKEIEAPWVIGWFGVLRCAESLKILSELAARNNGNIQVILRGRPAYDQMPDFDDIISKTDHLEFKGPYQYPDDLERIYSEIDFTWAIDKFEKGLNSSWLLPNRLYEGCLYGSIPIAEKHVQTGQYLQKKNIGVLLEEPLLNSAQTFFDHLDEEHARHLKEAVNTTQQTEWMTDIEECKDVVQWITHLKQV